MVACIADASVWGTDHLDESFQARALPKGARQRDCEMMDVRCEMEEDGLKVLAIDDSEDSLMALKAVLMARFRTTLLLAAVTGAQGLELARIHHPDVILLDIIMSEMDGYEVCRRLKEDERLRTIPVLFMTVGENDGARRIAALEAGAEGFLSKPLDEAELVAQIRSMAKIKAANRLQRVEKARLAELVAERTRELQQELAERKRAEEALRQSETMYRSLFENMMNGFAYCRMLFEDGKPWDFVYLAVNDAFERQTGLKNVVGRKVSEVIPGIREADPRLLEIYGRVATTGQPEHFEILVEALQMWFSVSVYCPGLEHFVTVFDAITERKRTEAERELTERLIAAVNTPGDPQARMSALTASLQTWSGCEAVGIRLREGDDYPYYATKGFPPAFVRGENRLCAYDQDGAILRDTLGNPVLECMCGNILCGRFDPSRPFFSAAGSFWSNNTTALLASTTESDRQARTRNRCNAEGYQSVALIPLRSDKQVFGLLQFNDHRADRFTPDLIANLERIASTLAIALSRHKSEEALRESEDRYRTILHTAMDGFALVDMAGRLLQVNEAYSRMSGYSERELLVMRMSDLEAAGTADAIAARIQKILAQGEDRFESRHRRKDGSIFEVEVSVRYLPGHGGRIAAFLRDITARKIAEREIRERSYLLSESQRIGHIGTWSCELPGNQMHWSDEAYRVFGVSQQTFVLSLTSFLELLHPEDRATMNEWIRACQCGDQPGELEFRIIPPDGLIRILSGRGDLLPATGSTPARMVGTVQDVTERKRVEETLRDAHQRLENIVQGTRAGTWEWNVQTGETVFNDVWARIVGYTLNELAPVSMKTWESLAPPDDTKASAALLERHFAGELPYYDYECRMKHKDGHWVWVHDRGCLISRTPDGNPLRMVGTRTDITDRKRAEERIRQLSSAVEQSPASVVITDPKGAIKYVNPTFTRVTGYTLDEVRGENPRVLKGDRTPAEEYRELWRTISQGKEWRGEFHNRKKTGEFYWESALISPIVDAQGHVTHFLAVKEDITERKALEEHLRQAQKIESVGQLAGGVAHDFNNILAVMMMHLSYLQQNEHLDEETQASVRDLMVEAKRAANLTRQLLIFSRRSVLEIKVVDLSEVVSNLLRMLRRLIGEHINLRFEHQEDVPPVEADPGMMEQVLMNLAVNARDAMHKGGNLTVSLESILVDAAAPGGNPQARSGRFVRLSVSDDGCGMGEATLKRLFEPFFTTKERGKGTGLGLATVHGIVAQHGGWVEVESALGKGTTFKVFLPATTKGKAEPAQTGRPATTRGHEMILLVEDEISVRRVAVQCLRRLGYQVLEATNGLEAIKLWQEHRNEVELLFSDMVMPEGVTGLDLAEKLREDTPGLKVIISSGYSTEMAGQAKPASEAIVYLQKPYELEVLSKTVRDCLDRR